MINKSKKKRRQFKSRSKKHTRLSRNGRTRKHVTRRKYKTTRYTGGFFPFDNLKKMWYERKQNNLDQYCNTCKQKM